MTICVFYFEIKNVIMVLINAMKEEVTMYPIYSELHDYISSLTAINCHSHHKQDSFFKGFGLDEILRQSYVSWCGVDQGSNIKSRERYLDLVKYKSYFRALQSGLTAAYGFEEELSADNWEQYNSTIQDAHKDKNWHLKMLTDVCNYETSILDAYWQPGSDNGHPDVFSPTFRFDALFFATSPDDVDHNGTGAYNSFGWNGGNLDEYLDFVRKTIENAIKRGVCALKNAVPYDRGIDYAFPSKDEAAKALSKANPTTDDIRNFQDYIFHFIADTAADFDITIQCHTGMGALYNTRAIHMLDFIKRHPKTRFSLMHGGFPWTADIISFLDLFPNVFADVCWLPLLSPTAAEHTLHQLIEAGTSNRIVWGCDTWTGEESLGARIMMESVLSNVLTSKVVGGYFSLSDAKTLAEKIMYSNAKILFKL